MIIHFYEPLSLIEKKRFARDFLKQKENYQIKTVLEKVGKIKGRLRKAELRFLNGERNFIAEYKENGCIFKFDLREAYFSPRLSWNRQKIAEDVAKKVNEKKSKILVMFSGISPYPIILARYLKSQKKKAFIVSSEINQKACKIGEENVRLNKLQDYISVLQGDSKKIGLKLKAKKLPLQFDFILMPRPNLRETFLSSALKLGKKGTKYYYHGFGEKGKVLNEIQKDAKNKIKILSISQAGDIGPRLNRWLVVFEKV